MLSSAGFEIIKKDPTSNARLGTLKTRHGVVETPAYVIVGTHGKIRCLEGAEIEATKTQMIISNTYHLWRTLGDEGLNSFVGLHEYMGWQGPIMTDSGGFQVFSLGFLREFGLRRGGMQGRADSSQKSEGKLESVSENLVRITPSGVYFREIESEDEEYLDAELSVRIQEQLGADIIVAFDEPTSPKHDHEYTRAAMERTHAWAKRSLDAKADTNQMMYGVVQGGNFQDLRSESARFIGAMPFDGFAIGGTYGEGYGGTREDTRNMLEWSIPRLPATMPRHLFGVGRIEDLFLGVEQGIDTFDCVIPTREARHGRLWTSSGHIDITKGAFRSDDRPIDSACTCSVCADGFDMLNTSKKVTRRELHDYFKTGSSQAGNLATLHNVYFFNDLMERIRSSISEDNFKEFKDHYLSQLKTARTPEK
jgi:queuine tRNA-ribosyltransferase